MTHFATTQQHTSAHLCCSRALIWCEEQWSCKASLSGWRGKIALKRTMNQHGVGSNWFQPCFQQVFLILWTMSNEVFFVLFFFLHELWHNFTTLPVFIAVSSAKSCCLLASKRLVQSAWISQLNNSIYCPNLTDLTHNHGFFVLLFTRMAAAMEIYSAKHWRHTTCCVSESTD